MPKGKAKQRNAGTAAVPAARVPAFTPPDAAAHAKYLHLVDVFSRAFEQAGVHPPKELWDLWGHCCRHKGDFSSRHALLGFFASQPFGLCREPNAGKSVAYDLMRLFVQRTLVIAGIIEHLFLTLISHRTINRDSVICIALLAIILPRTCLEEVPEECLPEPSESYAALAPLHWHPRGIELACRGLLEESTIPSVQTGMASFIDQLQDPEDSDAANVDYRAVLDHDCMSAIWGVLHTEYSAHAVTLLRKLTFGVAFNQPDGTSHTTGTLLSVEGAKPLSSALNHLTDKLLEQQQQQQQEQSLILSTLRELMSAIKYASILQAPRSGNSANLGMQPAWPREVLHAHLRALVKVLMPSLYRDGPDREPGTSCAIDIDVYPVGSMHEAAHILSRDPSMLSGVVCFIERSAAGIHAFKGQAAKTGAANGCRAGLQFLLGLQTVSDFDSEFNKRFPFYRLASSAIKAIIHASEETQHLWELPHTGPSLELDGVSVGKATSIYTDLVSKAEILLQFVSKLPWGDELARVLRSELDGYPHWSKAVQTRDGRQRFKTAAEGGLLVMGNALAHALRERAEDGSSSGSSGVRCASRESAANGSDGSRGNGASSSAKRSSSSKHPDPPVQTATGSSGNAEASAKGGSTSKPERLCANCGRGGKLKMCSRCESAWFCGSDCQRAAWGSHRLVCMPKGAAGP